VAIEHLKQNNKATTRCILYLTKPLGVGILTTAQKKGLLKKEHATIAPQQMVQLNKLGAELGKLAYVKALTDVTGFGLLGHLAEVCEGSKVKAVIEFDKVPKIAVIEQYIEQKCIPGGTHRNWDSYGHKIGRISDYQKLVLSDPQTSGGLLIAVEEDKQAEFENWLQSKGIELESFGYLTEHKPGETFVEVE
jgi:selenide,water dikinase